MITEWNMDVTGSLFQLRKNVIVFLLSYMKDKRNEMSKRLKSEAYTNCAGICPAKLIIKIYNKN